MESVVHSSISENCHHQITYAKFNLKIYYLISNYFPHETIICNDRDPPWINKNIKNLINDKNHAYQSFSQNGNNSSTSQNFQFLQSRLNSLIEKSEHKYYAHVSKKLLDPATSPKLFWSLLKTFLNNKKISCIPPLLHENKFIINFRRKVETFNTCFVKQCSFINTCSDLPTLLTKKTNEPLSKICFTGDDILKNKLTQIKPIVII